MLRFLNCSLLVLVCTPVYAVSQSISTEPIPTIHTTSRLVIADVVATDSRQNPVHHLSASDFTILEDGHPQTLKVFEEHTADSAAVLSPLPELPPGKFTNYSVAPTNGALNILLLDKLNTPMEAQAVVRDQVLKYLKDAPTGTRMAIFALTTQLKLLQGFTSDPTLLRRLVEGRHGLPGSSPLMSSGDVDSDNLMTDSIDSANNDIMGNSPDAATILSNLQQFEAEQQSFQSMLRARYTLDALNQLARYLSELPGRKNLIWFSGSFPLNIQPDGDLQDPFAAVANAEDEFRETVNMLARSQVAVYPIDARQLMTDPMVNAGSSGRNYVKDGLAADRAFYRQLDSEHNTMNQMAEATGGKAFMNTNDLKSAVGKAIEAGSNYYTLAYTPTNPKEDGEYRKIEVKLNRPGVKLAYRRGYFTDEPSTSKPHNEAQGTQPDPTAYSAIRTAMLHGAPEPDQLVFVADVRPTNTGTEPEPAPGNQPEPKTSGPYRPYTATFMLNPKDLNCDPMPDGGHHCEIEFLTFVYDADGSLINAQMNEVNANFSPERYASFLKRPLGYHQQISVPAKGEYYLRLGLRDETADHIGALEIPVAAVAKLPPLPASRPAPGASPK
jgi:VWFA-related protein